MENANLNKDTTHSERSEPVSSPRRKPVWIIAGWISLALAFVGVFLPVVPQIPFAILAAIFFSKGSSRLHHWLLNHEKFGAPLRDWEMDRVIRWRTKIASCVLMVGGATIAFLKFREENPGLVLWISMAFAFAIVFVLTRRSRSRPSDDSKDAVRLPPSAMKGT